MIHLYNMDCMEAMAQMDDNAFDLAVVDPPYGINENGKRDLMNKKPCKTWKNPKLKQYLIKDWDNKRPTQKYFDELRRVSKYQIIWGGNYFADLLPASGSWIVWDKKVNMPTFSDGELAWCNIKNSVKFFRFLWAGYAKAEPINRIHPTEKPEKLYTWCISQYAQKGWRILDTHLGSGSSAIAAYNAGYEFHGYELDTDYYKAAKKRFENHKKQLRMFV